MSPFSQHFHPLERKPSHFVDQRCSSRARRWVWLFGLCVLLPFGSAWGEPGLDLWVDARAPGGGEGTQAHPASSLNEALTRAPNQVRLHLASGEYEAAFTVQRQIEIVGMGANTELHLASGIEVESAGTLVLRKLSVRGGPKGIVVSGKLELENVQVIGQTVLLEANSRAEIRSCRFGGAYRRAIEARSPKKLEVVDVQFDGTGTAVHQLGGNARWEHLVIGDGEGPALFLAQGRVTAKNLDIHGHEEGLEVGRGAVLQLKGLTTKKVRFSALVLVQAQAVLEDLTLKQSGNTGAISMIGGTVTLRDFRIEGARTLGLTARQGALTLQRGSIVDVDDREGGLGHGLSIRAQTAVIDGLSVTRVAGSCIVLAEESKVKMGTVSLDHCGVAGLWVERASRLEGKRAEVRDGRGAALAVSDRSWVHLHLLVSERNVEGPLWAACDQGVRVLLSKIESDIAPPALSCLSR